MISIDHESAIARFVEEALGADFPHRSEIAHALETYCEIHFQDRALNADHLSLLLSRALIKSGSPQTARHLLAKRDAGFEGCLAALGQENCPHRVIAGLSARLVRPSRWAAAGDSVVWTLDLRRLKHDPLARLEIGLLPAIRLLLEEAVPFWDEGSGRGGLALRGLADLALDRETVSTFCRDWLDAAAKSRGWDSKPSLLILNA